MSWPVNSELIKELRTWFISRKEVEWRDWTPTITQLGAVTYNSGHALHFARYHVIGNTVSFRCLLAVTSAGTAGNVITIGGLPFTPANAGVAGSIRVIDTGTASYTGALVVAVASTAVGVAHNSTGSIGVIPNFALASGDFIDLAGFYERT